MTEHLLSIFLVTIDIIIEMMFFKSISSKERFTVREICLLCLLIVEGIITAVFMADYAVVRIVINLAFSIIVTKFIFKVSLVRSIIYNLIFFGTFTSIEMVVMLVSQYALGSDKYSDLTNSSGAAVMEIICCLIMMLIIVVINFKRKKSAISRLDIKGWIAFALYPLTTLIVSMFLLYIPIDQISQTVFSILLAFVFSMLVLSIVQFILLENVVQREYEIYRKQLLIDQAEHANHLYKTLSEEREIQKARSHDYLNHLNALLALAEGENRTKEIRYLKEQIGIETENFDIIDTGDAVVNAVLNIKYREAKEKGIVMPLQIDDLRDLSISESDIVTILSNILDNAIKATESCDVKRIVLHITKQENGKVLCIDSSNTCLCDNYPGRSRYTTKDDKENHGYGISNIKYAVEKNNGECIIESRKGIFRIIISIPL